MFRSATDRVHRNTSNKINEQIAERTTTNIGRFAHARAYEIDRRLAELEREWDIERCLETMAPTITLVGLGLGLTRNKRWLLVPLLVQSFFLLHAVQGWCPPLPVLRRLGIRTKEEIDRERYALKALRGDFGAIPEDAANANRKAAAVAAVGL